MFWSRRRTRWSTEGALVLVFAMGALLALSASLTLAKGKPPKPPAPPPPEPAYDFTQLPENPSAMNDSGDALGSPYGTGDIVALRSQPVMIPLDGLPGSSRVSKADLNNEDAYGVFQVVGHCDFEVVEGSQYRSHALLWEVDADTGEVSGPFDLDPENECLEDVAGAVNDLGEIAGFVQVEVEPGVAPLAPVVWRPDGTGGFEVLELPRHILNGVAVFATPVDINNLGQVVGAADVRNALPGVHSMYPVLWQIDDSTGEYLEPIDLGTLKQGAWSHPVAINDWGQVIGYTDTKTSATFQAWLINPRDVDGDGALEWFWDGDGDGANDLMVPLCGAGVSSKPTGLNNVGQIVGSQRKKTGYGGQWGFIWQNGVMTLLGELVPPEYGDPVASCINDAGQLGASGGIFTPRP